MQAPSTVAIGPVSTHALMRLIKLDIVGRCFSRQTPALFELGVDPLLKKKSVDQALLDVASPRYFSSCRGACRRRALREHRRLIDSLLT
jgi:hypothetical protein